MKKTSKIMTLSLKLSLAFLAIVTLGALLAGLSPYDPNQVDLLSKFQDPSGAHWFGTDNFGRDYFTRILYGGRVSLSVGALSMLVSITFGTLYGIVSGSSGRFVDAVMMRFVDILMAVPSFLLIITMNVYLNASLATTVLTISLFSWMGVARIVRAEVLSLRERDFILASRGLGAGKGWIIFRHMIKNVSSSVMVAATNSIASAILTESSLSYLGFGIKIPNASWGGMLENAQTYILTKPILAVYPGLCILLTVLSFNVLGNSLRTILDPKSRR
ncbi:MAG: ABC transporter permease [Clostridia bacterium]|nr:ABC transporter permease [Clostridia bacterium]